MFFLLLHHHLVLIHENKKVLIHENKKKISILNRGLDLIDGGILFPSLFYHTDQTCN